MAFEYDRVKNEHNRSKHGFPLSVAPLLFDGPFVEEEDRRREYDETRFIAMGPIVPFGDRVFVVVYTWRNGARRIISLRKANGRETRRYHASVA